MFPLLLIGIGVGAVLLASSSSSSSAGGAVGGGGSAGPAAPPVPLPPGVADILLKNKSILDALPPSFRTEVTTLFGRTLDPREFEAAATRFESLSFTQPGDIATTFASVATMLRQRATELRNSPMEDEG